MCGLLHLFSGLMSQEVSADTSDSEHDKEELRNVQMMIRMHYSVDRERRWEMIRNRVELGIAAGGAIQLTDGIAANLSERINKDVVLSHVMYQERQQNAHAVVGR